MISLPGILTGILAGYIASYLQKGKGSGCVINLFLGLVGGALGGFLFNIVGLESKSWLGEVLVAVVGAVILLWLFKKLK